MHHYLYDKSDIILSKTEGFTTFSMRKSVWQQSVLWVMSSVLWHVWLTQHISLKITLKQCFHFIGYAHY